ncbi:MAG: peptidoglycan editing factor PgeF [Acidobacteriota bacterium]|nr:peptidoglycan editing factor PgeF [Acidobacteriota bacterium]
MPLERACRKAGPHAPSVCLFCRRYNQRVKRTESSQRKKPDNSIHGLDNLFAHAGLVRSRRGTPAGITRELRLERAMPQELTQTAPEPRVAANGVEWLAAPGWNRMQWLWHGFSTRRGGGSRAYCSDDAPGELNLGFTASDDRAVVVLNRRLLAEAITGSAETPLVTLKQVHSNVLVRASAADAGLSVPHKGDGLVTDQPGFLLAVQTADCIPVLVADTKRRVVAAFHAGWRGTVKRIVETGVGRMRLEFGCRPEDLVAAIGPGIGACCYSVGDEVLSAFESQFAYARELFREVYDSDPVRIKYPMLFLTQRAPGHSPIGPNLHVDLTEANRRQLLDAGVKATAIRVVGGCTSCQRELFFSHRGSQGFAGRMMSVIGIRVR